MLHDYTTLLTCHMWRIKKNQKPNFFTQLTNVSELEKKNKIYSPDQRCFFCSRNMRKKIIVLIHIFFGFSVVKEQKKIIYHNFVQCFTHPTQH